METLRVVSWCHRYFLELKRNTEFRNNIFQLKVWREVCLMWSTDTLLITFIYLSSDTTFLFSVLNPVFLFYCYSHNLMLGPPLPGLYYIFAISCLCLIWCLHMAIIVALEHPPPQSTPLSAKLWHLPFLLLSLSDLFPWSCLPHRPTHLVLLQLPSNSCSEISVTYWEYFILNQSGFQLSSKL